MVNCDEEGKRARKRCQRRLFESRCYRSIYTFLSIFRSFIRHPMSSQRRRRRRSSRRPLPLACSPCLPTATTGPRPKHHRVDHANVQIPKVRHRGALLPRRRDRGLARPRVWNLVGIVGGRVRNDLLSVESRPTLIPPPASPPMYVRTHVPVSVWKESSGAVLSMLMAK